MGKNIITINPGEYKFSVDPNEVLYTQGLDSCVGLALVEDFKNMRKRGLTHIYWGGDKEIENSEGRLIIPESEIQGIDDFLEKFIGKFKRKPFEDIDDFGKMYSMMIFNRPFYGPDKINENPLATHVMDWLLNKNINLAMSEGINKWNKISVSYKEVALHQDKLAVMYRNNRGTLLNYRDINDNFSDFPL